MMQAESTPVAVTRPDGGLSIVWITTIGRGNILPDGAQWYADNGWWARLPSDAVISAEVGRAVPDAVSWRKVAAEEIPADRAFRDAIVIDGEALVHDVGKAREVIRSTVRHERAQAMPMLDVRFMRAVADDNRAAIKAVEAERQRWRDAPADPRIDNAKSIEDLKAVLGR